jgi:hypothetical protein
MGKAAGRVPWFTLAALLALFVDLYLKLTLDLRGIAYLWMAN